MVRSGLAGPVTQLTHPWIFHPDVVEELEVGPLRLLSALDPVLYGQRQLVLDVGHQCLKGFPKVA